MLQFIRENINAIVSVSVMVIYWFMFNYRSVAANVNNIENTDEVAFLEIETKKGEIVI